MLVYLDIIWLLNFLIDSLLLWITAIFLKKPIHPFRILLGGALGSILIFLAITPFASLAAHPLIKICLSLVIVFITFGYKKLSTFISCVFTFYFATFLMGGILMGTHYFLTFEMDLKSMVVIESIRGYGDPVSWLFLFGAFPIAWYFSKKRVEGITISNIQYDVLNDVSIELNGMIFNLKGLIDSGNQLYDPISKSPVMIVSIQSLKDRLPLEIQLVADDKNDLYHTAANLSSEWSDIMRLIPAKSLGRNNQLLCAFKPEKLILHDDKEMKIVRKALIVFTAQALSSDGRFQCIIHPHMASEGLITTAS